MGITPKRFTTVIREVVIDQDCQVPVDRADLKAIEPNFARTFHRSLLSILPQRNANVLSKSARGSNRVGTKDKSPAYVKAK